MQESYQKGKKGKIFVRHEREKNFIKESWSEKGKIVPEKGKNGKKLPKKGVFSGASPPIFLLLENEFSLFGSRFFGQIFFPFISDKNFSLFPFLVRFLHIRKDSTRKGKREKFLYEVKGKKIWPKNLDPKREKSYWEREKRRKTISKKGFFGGFAPDFSL